MNAEASREGDHVGDADFFHQLHGGDVARAGEGAAQGDEALEFFIVIVRRIGLAAADGGVGLIENRVEGIVAGLKCRGIDVDLE